MPVSSQLDSTHQVSYLEIYNEVINDLLAPESVNLKIREEKGRGVYVDGLKEEVVVSPEQVMSLIAGGEGTSTWGPYMFRTLKSTPTQYLLRSFVVQTLTSHVQRIGTSVPQTTTKSAVDRIRCFGWCVPMLVRCPINLSVCLHGQIIESKGLYQEKAASSGGSSPVRVSVLVRVFLRCMYAQCAHFESTAQRMQDSCTNQFLHRVSSIWPGLSAHPSRSHGARRVATSTRVFSLWAM